MEREASRMDQLGYKWVEQETWKFEASFIWRLIKYHLLRAGRTPTKWWYEGRNIPRHLESAGKQILIMALGFLLFGSIGEGRSLKALIVFAGGWSGREWIYWILFFRVLSALRGPFERRVPPSFQKEMGSSHLAPLSSRKILSVERKNHRVLVAFFVLWRSQRFCVFQALFWTDASEWEELLVQGTSLYLFNPSFAPKWLRLQ